MVKKTPLQQLSVPDRAALTNFISYQDVEDVDIDKVFRYWDKSKRKLYKMLGYKLRRSFPIHIERDNNYVLLSELPNLYNNPIVPFYAVETDRFQRWINKEKNLFIKTAFQHMLDLYNNADIAWVDVYNFVTLCKHYSIIRGYTCIDYMFEYQNEQLKLNRHTKVMRAIRKILDFFGYPYMDLFGTWRDKVSVALSLKNMDTKVTLSIHPIDLISLSDNNSNWHSCLAWRTDGSYKYGTLEMLNSNMAIVAYIENTEREYEFYGKKAPNKMWRTLFFVDKNIILAGKDYPFNNHFLQEQVMDIILKLAKENLGYVYQYQKQEYYDIKRYHDNDECIQNMYYFRRFDHKIITYMRDHMYNDFINADWPALCSRNYVNKTKFINLSGPITCLACGDLVSNEHVDNDCLWCEKCNDNYCYSCTRNNSNHKHYSVVTIDLYGYKFDSHICEECLLKDYWYLNSNNVFISKLHYLKAKNQKQDTISQDKILPVTRKLVKEKGVLL